MDTLRQDVIKFLKDHQNNFAWCMEDMPGIDTAIAKDTLNISLVCRLVSQKSRQFGEEKYEV